MFQGDGCFCTLMNILERDILIAAGQRKEYQN